MTREEAIEQLQDAKDGYKEYLSNDALDIAIKALEHPEKNVVAVVPCGDCISRAEVLKLMQDNWHTHNGDWAMQESLDDIRALPSVTPQNQVYPLCEDCRTKMDEVRRAYDNAMKQEFQSFKWCTDCKEYDQEKHCCHRYSKVIRDTVAEIRQEPKIGHWIANAPQYDMLNPQYICSECGNAHTRTTPYCEMCGAKMVEPQESEVNNG